MKTGKAVTDKRAKPKRKPSEMAKRKPKPKRKPRRVVLGVGYPWFSGVADNGWLAVKLTKVAVHPSILMRTFDWKGIESGGLGNWNKIRLVAEVLK